MISLCTHTHTSSHMRTHKLVHTHTHTHTHTDTHAHTHISSSSLWAVYETLFVIKSFYDNVSYKQLKRLVRATLIFHDQQPHLSTNVSNVHTHIIGCMFKESHQLYMCKLKTTQYIRVIKSVTIIALYRWFHHLLTKDHKVIVYYMIWCSLYNLTLYKHCMQ